MTWTLTLSSKGQVVLPKPLREHLRLRAGSKLVIAEREGHYELKPIGGSILDWYGSQPTDEAEDWASVRAATRQARSAEVIRETEGD